MRVKNKLKIISYLIALVPFIGAGCKSDGGELSPKYLLTGSQAATSGNFVYYSINNGTEYAVALSSTGKSATGTISIDDSYNDKPITGIWRYGFANSKASTVSFPSTLTVIDFEAFMASNITSLTIPASITDIGEGAFYACKKLTKVSIQNTTTASETSSACSCTEVTETSGEREYCTLTVIPAFCFYNCSNLKELVLPQSIEEVGNNAFNACRALYSTIAFMNIKTIRSRAFQGCAALKNVYISSSFFANDPETSKPLGVIEDKAFDDCNGSLKFYLVGDTAAVETWLNDHSDNKWRWKNETTNPASATNLYAYEITSSGASYTNDWIYTTVNNEVEISSYIGPTEIDDQPVKFLSIPNELPSGSGNKVRKISIEAFNTVKANLVRLYLPSTLKRIEANMFNADYDNLVVVDVNTQCSSDEGVAVDSLEKRIDLSALTELEVIGNSAFLNMDKLTNIKKLHLPYSLKAVGAYAFGSASNDSKHMMACTDFVWNYDDTKSCLKVIGREAFYELGATNKSKALTTAAVRQDYLASNGDEKYKLTTLVLPRTFEHFGITPNDNTTYTLGGAEDTSKGEFGRYAFAGCPLLSEVVFKGSKKTTVQAGAGSDNDTCHLLIPHQTFSMNVSLRIVVFEERCGKSILFHTNGNTCSPAVGWSAGRAKNDFNGDPAIQTIVLPNRYTTIRMQKFAMQGNSRAAVYLSGAEDSKFYGSNIASAGSIASNMNNIGNSSVAISTVSEWKLIGNESNFGNSYPGYCFAGKNNDISTDRKNRFGLDQSMPIYQNVLYERTITAPGVSNLEVFCGIGPSNSANELVEDGKFAFVCEGGNATLSKYLFDRHRPSSAFDGTAKVPATVTSSSGSCTVNKIGDSAFSAAYCDGNSYKNYSSYKNLTAVSLPDTITTIGNYAFLRAYGITNVFSYNTSTDASNGDYVMPSSLTSIGKQAFAFTCIKQILNIPLTCTLYETTVTTTYETSAFANNFSLRKITFGNGATASNYYTTTTYTSATTATYTSALYSKNTTTTNSNCLLVVLNRDNNDRLKASDDVAIIDDGGVDTVQFDGKHEDHFIYGAFKMCYWIDALIVGSSHDDSLDQPLISGIYDLKNNKDSFVYLNTANDFTGNSAYHKLKSITFSDTTSISTPPYSFEGCAKIEKVRLPRVVGGEIPAGLFASNNNPNIVFNVPTDITGLHYDDCDPGVLDLEFTGYTKINAEAFKGSGIKEVIAPSTSTFTLEVDSFGSCESLTSFDFSKVTDTVIINGAFRSSSINNDLFNFGTSAKIVFGDEAFKGATFPGKTFTFPSKTAIIGTSCFENCTTLENVTADSVLTQLDSVVVDNGSGQNNAGNNTGFKQIGDSAFFGCVNLKNFDMSKFSQIERIGHFAFSMVTLSAEDIGQMEKAGISNSACICANGEVELPASVTNIGVGAFYGSKIKTMTIKSTTMKFERGKDYTSYHRASYNKGGSTFRYCTELTTIMFTEPDCAWTTPYLLKSEGGQDNYFSNCGKLTAIYFPTGYNLQCPRYTGSTDGTRSDSMCWDSSKSLKFYVYHTVYDLTSGVAISDFWHRMSGGDIAPIVFYVDTNADIIKYEGGQYKEYRSGTTYWTIYNDEAVYLGTASVNSSTGLVTFSVSGGYTADSSGVHKA